MLPPFSRLIVDGVPCQECGDACNRRRGRVVSTRTTGTPAKRAREVAWLRGAGLRYSFHCMSCPVLVSLLLALLVFPALAATRCFSDPAKGLLVSIHNSTDRALRSVLIHEPLATQTFTNRAMSKSVDLVSLRLKVSCSSPGCDFATPIDDSTAVRACRNRHTTQP